MVWVVFAVGFAPREVRGWLAAGFCCVNIVDVRENRTSLGARSVAWGVVVACCLCVAVGCKDEAPENSKDPVTAVRVFIQSVYYGNGEVAFRLLQPQTQDTLRRRAEEVNDAAGQEVVEPHELISSSGFLAPRYVKKVERIDDESDPDRASLKVKTHPGAEYDVQLVRVDGVWRVVIPERQ